MQAVDLIQRAQRLIDSRKLKISAVKELTALSDAVLSFTAYYLRHAEAACRPEQRLAFDQLQSLVIQLEKP
jgi:hypothetical protein